MAYNLALQTNVTLELVIIDRNKAAAKLDAGYVDVIISGVAVTLEKAQAIALSAPYMDATLVYSRLMQSRCMHQ